MMSGRDGGGEEVLVILSSVGCLDDVVVTGLLGQRKGREGLSVKDRERQVLDKVDKDRMLYARGPVSVI